jgi:hypothetical protein
MKKLFTLLFAAVTVLSMFLPQASAQTINIAQEAPPPVSVQAGTYKGWNAALRYYSMTPTFTLNAGGTFELETETIDGTAYANGTWDTQNTGGKTTVTLHVVKKDDGRLDGLFKESYTFELTANGVLTTKFTDNAVFYTSSEYRLYNPGPSAWARDQVNEAIALGLVPEPLQTGYQRPITRGEFCRVAVMLYEMKNGIINPGRENFDYYTDAYDEYPAKARTIGIMGETVPGKFSPYSNLTREQAAVALNNLSSWLDLKWGRQPLRYGDAASISSWAKDAVGAVSNAGIMGSTDGNMFSPKGVFTREQAYVTLYKMYTAARAAGGWFFMDESDVY